MIFNWLDPSRRRLLQALILSVVIHALILFRVADEFPVRTAMPAPPFRVELHTVAVQTTLPQAPPSQSLPTPNIRRLPGGKTSVMASLSPSPSLPLIRPAPAIVPSARIDGASRPEGAQTSESSSATLSSPDGVNANDLRQYRVALAIAARRFRYYPVLARERGWEGTVEIALLLHAASLNPEVVVVRSSGYVVLDRQAQEMMVQAAQATELPTSMQGLDFRMRLPVQFSLDADQ